MNHNHPGVTIGSLGPIGMVTAPGPSGPVGIGIGVPIMSASPMVSHIAQMQHHHQKKLVSPDSSDDKDAYVSQLFTHRSSPPGALQVSSNGGNPLTWSNPMLQSTNGMGYSVMGMSMMGPSPTQGLSDASILYGLIGTAANGTNLNISNSGVNITSPPNNSVTSGLTHSNGTGNNNSSVTVPPENHSTTQSGKEIIHCKVCTLFPPNPTAPPPTTRDKPPGCRTVFVGGLPENITEEIIREIFDRCGEIITIRMSKKNFCHIRFELEQSIEAAVFLSGYRIRIGSNSDPPNIGRLHVDYAQARDDLFEWECRQRQLLREQRHRERIEQERLLPPSPPSVALYSDHEAANVAEKIKSDDSFIKGIHIVVGWLERGDCVKRNANSFYSMIQCTNSHVRRLLNEKSQYDEELQKAKDLMRQRVTGLLLQFSQIEKVFVSACQKKAWDHFTKAQRKNIEMWRKQATEIKGALLEEALAERNDEEMDFSDSENETSQKASDNDDSPPSKKSRLEDTTKKAVHQLKEENDSLRCQLEASSNEVDLMKADLKADMDTKDLQLKMLHKQLVELQNSMGNKTSTSIYDRSSSSGDKSCSSTTILIPNLEQSMKDNPGPGYCDSSSTSDSVAKAQNSHLFSGADDNQRRGATTTVTSITETDARLIGIISTFLHVHPFGASLDYIWSYTQKVLPSVRPNELELLLNKFPILFRQEISGVGASLERKWVFIGFS